MDVWIESVEWMLEPSARWHDLDEPLEIVKPDRDQPEGGIFRVGFVDGDGVPFPKQTGRDGHGNPVFASTRGGPEVVYSFIDAKGKRWRTGTFVGTPERGD